jgi:DNA invertase Pin-like site-specific DNA recombinase
MKAIVPGDTTVVTKLDRLARFEPGLASNEPR